MLAACLECASSHLQGCCTSQSHRQMIKNPALGQAHARPASLIWLLSLRRLVLERRLPSVNSLHQPIDDNLESETGLEILRKLQLRKYGMQ